MLEETNIVQDGKNIVWYNCHSTKIENCIAQYLLNLNRTTLSLQAILGLDYASHHFSSLSISIFILRLACVCLCNVVRSIYTMRIKTPLIFINPAALYTIFVVVPIQTAVAESCSRLRHYPPPALLSVSFHFLFIFPCKFAHLFHLQFYYASIHRILYRVLLFIYTIC